MTLAVEGVEEGHQRVTSAAESRSGLDSGRAGLLARPPCW